MNKKYLLVLSAVAALASVGYCEGNDITALGAVVTGWISSAVTVVGGIVAASLGITAIFFGVKKVRAASKA